MATELQRQAARGLTWLTLAKDSAFRQATEDEKALAALYLKRWPEPRRK